MRIDEVTKREAELIKLYGRAKEASDNFNNACKQTSVYADTTPKVVRQYIAALASEKANTVIQETEQLVMLFQNIPTVTRTAA